MKVSIRFDGRPGHVLLRPEQRRRIGMLLTPGDQAISLKAVHRVDRTQGLAFAL